MIEILEKIRALPEVSAFQFGFVKAELPEQPDNYEWHAMLNGHPYGGATAVPAEPAMCSFGAAVLLQAALESLEKGIADAKRFAGKVE